ncbi:MAG TPA: hypothetical protein EYH22_00765 [Candidatus Nanopusillus sp.]|nr:hypothetical protein [Candidatus Nanopusillus sp.]
MKIALVGDRSFKTLLKKNLNKLNCEFIFLDELTFNILMEKSFDILIVINYFKNIPGNIIEYFKGGVFAIYILLDVETVYLKVYHVTNEILYNGNIMYERNINKTSEIIKAIIDTMGYIRDNFEKFIYYKNSKFITIND